MTTYNKVINNLEKLKLEKIRSKCMVKYIVDKMKLGLNKIYLKS